LGTAQSQDQGNIDQYMCVTYLYTSQKIAELIGGYVGLCGTLVRRYRVLLRRSRDLVRMCRALVRMYRALKLVHVADTSLRVELF